MFDGPQESWKVRALANFSAGVDLDSSQPQNASVSYEVHEFSVVSVGGRRRAGVTFGIQAAAKGCVTASVESENGRKDKKRRAGWVTCTYKCLWYW